jgi:carbon storage regulator
LRGKRRSVREGTGRTVGEGGNILFLSRKFGEILCIGEDICIKVVDIDRGRILSGIKAPPDVPISRAELAPDRNTGSGSLEKRQAWRDRS